MVDKVVVFASAGAGEGTGGLSEGTGGKEALELVIPSFDAAGEAFNEGGLFVPGALGVLQSQPLTAADDVLEFRKRG